MLMKHSGDLFSISVNETTNGKSVITRVAVTDSKILLHTSGKVRELPIGFDTKFEITVVKEENAKSKHLLKLFCQEQTYSF
jgi:plasmid rolling circle replication initiator protein Rep